MVVALGNGPPTVYVARSFGQLERKRMGHVWERRRTGRSSPAPGPTMTSPAPSAGCKPCRATRSGCRYQSTRTPTSTRRAPSASRLRSPVVTSKQAWASPRERGWDKRDPPQPDVGPVDRASPRRAAEGTQRQRVEPRHAEEHGHRECGRHDASKATPQQQQPEGEGVAEQRTQRMGTGTRARPTSPPRATSNSTIERGSGNTNSGTPQVTFNDLAADGDAYVVLTRPRRGPRHPTYYLGPYGSVPAFYTSSHIRSQAQADRISAAHLADHIGASRTISFDAVPNPALTPVT